METRREGSLDLNRHPALRSVRYRRERGREWRMKGKGEEGGKKGESPVSHVKRLRKSEILPRTPGNLGSLVTIFYLYEHGAAVVPIA